jgi:hypothetical protein
MGLDPLLEGLYAQTRKQKDQKDGGEEEEWWVPE